jgi:hypothetical protein
MSDKTMLDTVYLNCRREAVLIFLLWMAVSTYSIVVSYLYGYTSHETSSISAGLTIEEFIGPLESFNRDPSSLTTPLGLGIPDWVFYAIVVPWFFCIVFTWFFCVFYMKDDDLGEECPGSDGEGNTVNG